MDDQKVADADTSPREPDDADRNLPAARWIRAIITADHGWTVRAVDPFDMSPLRGQEAREIRVPIVAWGIDSDGEIQPLVRARRGVLRSVADVFGGGEGLISITPPDDWPTGDAIVGPGVHEEGGAKELPSIQRLRRAAAGE